MAENKEFLMTQEEYDELREKLDYLKNEKTREIAEKINQARGYGDLSENAEYDAAKAEQAENADVIREYEEKIKYAKVVSKDKIDSSIVNIGLSVDLLDIELNEKTKYTITGATGFDPMNNKISVNSPVAKAILGKKAGDVVSVETPAGMVEYKIVKIYKK
ncbi:MAG: transcription elongation factor GreA [Clostridia bacterium]|nr:transcription elongation factor GreA [Clostridia bacterium]